MSERDVRHGGFDMDSASSTSRGTAAAEDQPIAVAPLLGERDLSDALALDEKTLDILAWTGC